ncbi:hypothetical protein BTH160X_130004 [Brochothrix thermosphacta]|nr:hypothetical protein BTH160X_130004 [Brochothrix thermosphacta]
MSFTHVKQHRYIRKAIPTGMAFFCCNYRNEVMNLRKQYGTEIAIAIEYQTLC